MLFARRNRKFEVLNLIRKRDGISRAELAKVTGLTRPAISSIINYLLDRKYVSESGKGESRGGKRPILLQLNKDSVYVIGIDLADELYIRGVVCNLGGEILKSEEITYENSFPEILKRIQELIFSLMSNLDKERIKGIGIAVSGIVDNVRSKIIHSSNFDIAHQDLGGLLENKFNLPVILENRPNAAALAEKNYGVGEAYQNLVYLSTGMGIGAGIISNGRIYQGSFGGAGEIRKIIIPFNGGNPNDGEEAELEFKIRESYIVKAVEKVKNQRYTYKELLELFCAGDMDVTNVFHENAANLAYGAGVISNIINPEVLVLGGRVRELGENYMNHFRKSFYKYISMPYINKTKVLVSKFGREGTAFGGAVLVLNSITVI